MGAIASQITSLTIVYSTVYSDADQRKHQSSASLTFVRGIHRGPVNSPHKWPVTREMFPFDDVIMTRKLMPRRLYRLNSDFLELAAHTDLEYDRVCVMTPTPHDITGDRKFRNIYTQKIYVCVYINTHTEAHYTVTWHYIGGGWYVSAHIVMVTSLANKIVGDERLCLLCSCDRRLIGTKISHKFNFRVLFTENLFHSVFHSVVAVIVFGMIIESYWCRRQRFKLCN